MKKVIPSDSVLVPDNAKLAFEGMIFNVYQWDQTLFDNSTHTFEMLKRTDTVSVICIVDDKILVLNDVQPHLGARECFPGGRVDDTDSSIQAAAQREILEETGYSFNNWRLIKVSQPYRKIEWFVYVWLAWDVFRQQEPQADPGEKITMQQLTFQEVKEKVQSNGDYLGESRDIFSNLNSVHQLTDLPQFSGIEVDR